MALFVVALMVEQGQMPVDYTRIDGFISISLTAHLTAFTDCLPPGSCC